ncbi:hypothetical protein [Lelliottia sp. RWM.1]|uniref:hypothetical protein n=1 Tax=Lelliottia sp. RWM.1 TaxID=2663242 RepID=UPI00193D8003|nr:hypothetical protein [Lelliottia sp. RWM.1]MBM3070377.1 hypothetical protein [Lelliottia sp. RWM.1]
MADKLIRVNSSVFVMTSDVLSVRYIDYCRVQVSTIGDSYLLEIPHGRTAWQSMDSFISEVNKALSNHH